jgi:hypothetical protein
MSYIDLVLIICLAVAVFILGAAILWAFVDIKRDTTDGRDRRSMIKGKPSKKAGKPRNR